MKNFATLLIILLIASACKKGKDDHFLSLKSRDARLKGEWELKELHIHSPSDSSDYDGTTFRHTNPNGNVTQYQYHLTYKFIKNGRGTLTEIIDGTSKNVDFDWAWLDMGKKKSGIHIQQTGIFQIDRLTSKEMVLSLTYSDEQGEYSQTITNYLKLTKK